MRKVLVLVAVAAVTAATFSPAEAARTSRSFSISASVDNRKMDLNSATGGNRSTKISGRVKGGKLKGRTVRIYVTNVHTAARTKRSLGSAKLSSKGRFTKTFAPSEGGTYLVEIRKAAGNGRKATTEKIYAHAYEWPVLDRFYDASASNPDPSAPLVERADKEQTGSGTSPDARWSTSYAITSGGAAVFAIGGYNCRRFHLKLAVSQSSRASSGTISISQGSRVLATETLQRGGGFWEPPRGLSESLHPDLPFVVSVPPVAAGSGEPQARMILGNPKASCTYPGTSRPYR